jgi:molybdopterin adenylyltransferase
MRVRAALITISTSKAAGDGEDESGPKRRRLALDLGAEVEGSDLIPDDRDEIERRLRHWSDERQCALVLTSGGTGLSHDDVTPEATRAVIDREIPGIAEAIRLASRAHTANWMLARPVAGVRGSTLIVNLPGSPRAIEQVGSELAPGLAHALALIGGRAPGHG